MDLSPQDEMVTREKRLSKRRCASNCTSPHSKPPTKDSSFDAAVHQQTIPEMQKLICLIASLEGDALLAVRGYGTAPEDIRRLRTEKYGQANTIKKECDQKERSRMEIDDRSYRKDTSTTQSDRRELETINYRNIDEAKVSVVDKLINSSCINE
ncbi:unnamed protein product [Litomosoides sigmodontis]|uniref:Uncharacterized protein n=1 Tax=Litomosoides sigmodontis TaxID=42156 RepID=A0A3P7KEN8_LITSI|nr:unnamed protein product [Litomosoides sigmodontis]